MWLVLIPCFKQSASAERSAGHTFCQHTLNTLFRTKARDGCIECPLCREEVAQADVYPIWLQFRDPEAPLSQPADGEPTQEIYSVDVLADLADLRTSMETINADSSADYIKRTAQTLQTVLEDVEAQSCVVTVMSGVPWSGRRSADR